MRKHLPKKSAYPNSDEIGKPGGHSTSFEHRIFRYLYVLYVNEYWLIFDSEENAAINVSMLYTTQPQDAQGGVKRYVIEINW